MCTPLRASWGDSEVVYECWVAAESRQRKWGDGRADAIRPAYGTGQGMGVGIWLTCLGVELNFIVPKSQSHWSYIQIQTESSQFSLLLSLPWLVYCLPAESSPHPPSLSTIVLLQSILPQQPDIFSLHASSRFFPWLLGPCMCVLWLLSSLILITVPPVLCP